MTATGPRETLTSDRPEGRAQITDESVSMIVMNDGVSGLLSEESDWEQSGRDSRRRDS